MKPSLRKVLAESHISAVAIVVLLFFSVASLLGALSGPFSRVVRFLFTAIAIEAMPYFSRDVTPADRVMLVISLSYVFSGLVSLAAAWLLSRWIYGVGPVQGLSTYRQALARRNHV
ncbi:MAG: hypothetical protein DMG21_10395 [Acidobacteria bacterium]|nr:MAG: hypothetical protein DMG21_10395 [Acidobacteriota bacterium]